MNEPKQSPQARMPVELQLETVIALRKLRSLFSNEIPDIDVGQIWRAEWESVTILGVTLSVEDGYTQFAPVTVDIDYADPYTVILSGEQSPLPVAVAVFASLATPVPVYVLEANLGTLSSGVISEITCVWRASVTGSPPQSIYPLGGQIADLLEVRSLYRQELLSQLTLLAAAVLDGDNVTLNSAASAARLRPSLVAEVLGLPLSTGRQIAVGRYPLSGPQVDRLAASLGCEVEDLALTTVTVPRPLLEALYSPRRFSVVRNIASANGVSYANAVAYLPSAAAARTQHAERRPEDSQQYWEDMLDALVVSGGNAEK
ncbi:hypothetical protein [Mycolicibacterium hippocampi]|uniref:Uncharacterized protein n=1 Tax=Mycolicibacterium hippocampi TaxID=659824 RepID=A0A7I9ZI73_9MYCO|nr:hypothetical protein [Mycolicibacterium hippocampi]GFH00523.1 hypothetical protein MHIP_10060 [Mycolicibacterium hippocampi]